MKKQWGFLFCLISASTLLIACSTPEVKGDNEGQETIELPPPPQPKSFPAGHPANNFPDCRFHNDGTTTLGPVDVTSTSSCEFRVRDFKTLCNVGGSGGEDGQAQLGVCHMYSSEHGSEVNKTPKPILTSAKWGTEYLVMARVKITDYTQTSDYALPYEVTFDDVHMFTDKKVEIGSCFPFSLSPIYTDRFDTKVFEKQASQLLGLAVRCKTKERCIELFKNGTPARACYDRDDFTSILVQ